MKLVIYLDRVANCRRHCEGNGDNGNDGDELDYEEVAEILGTKRRIMMIAKILGACCFIRRPLLFPGKWRSEVVASKMMVSFNRR